MRREDAKQPFIHAAEPEHNEMRRLSSQLRRTSGADPRHDDLVMELMRDVIHHVADEETRLLPDAEKILGKARLSELGAAMTRRSLQLVGPKAGKLAKEHLVGFSGSSAALAVGVLGDLIAAFALTPKTNSNDKSAEASRAPSPLPDAMQHRHRQRRRCFFWRSTGRDKGLASDQASISRRGARRFPSASYRPRPRQDRAGAAMNNCSSSQARTRSKSMVASRK